MSCSRSPLLDRLDQHRADARKELAACQPDDHLVVVADLSWPSQERTPWEVRADSLAIARLVEELAQELDGQPAESVFVAAYQEDLRYRQYVDMKVFNWTRASSPSGIEARGRSLLTACTKDAMPSALPDHAGMPKFNDEINLIQEAAKRLGGRKLAAELVGVSAGTLSGWIRRGAWMGRKEAAELLRLAGIHHNFWRNTILV